MKALTTLQLSRAYLLALAHHHTWADLNFRSVRNCIDAEDIRKRVHATLEPGPAGWGLDAPTVDSYGNIIHSTGTGRLAWSAHPDGSVTLTVARPSQVSLSLKLNQDLSSYEIGLYSPFSQGTRYLSVEVLEPEPHASGGVSYTPVKIIWTSAWDDENEGETVLNTSLGWIGKPSLPMHHRHIIALIQAYRCLNAPANESLELVFKILLQEARPDGIIVSKEPAEIELIHNLVAGSDQYPVLYNATLEDVLGQRVYGHLPMCLASMAESITIVEYRSPSVALGEQYPLDALLAAGPYLRTYEVT